MEKGFAAAAAAVLVIGAAVGCSLSQASPKPKPGTLPPGTAALTINGNGLGTTDTVQAPDEWLTTIRTDHEASSVTVMASNAHPLAAELIRILDRNGFTGSYDRGLQGEAAVAMASATYTIAGDAMGVNIAKPSEPTIEPFAIKVSGGHAAAAAQDGYGAMALAAFHPDRFAYAGSMSGFLYPSEATFNGAILAGMQQFAGIEGSRMWGAPQLGRSKWHDPYVHAAPTCMPRCWPRTTAGYGYSAHRPSLLVIKLPC